MNQEVAQIVLFDELPTAGGRRIGIATLNSPRTLNGFSLAMAQALDHQLRAWATDDGIALVVLQGAGEKAFCAGGDLHGLYRGMLADRADGATAIGADSHAARFFALEYRVDHAIYCYPKPVLCWGHGIVMGGGIGLMSGASHRIVSERSKLAFPEITVGLFPDVGGSWLLQRVPGRGGLFLALTGAPLGPGDAIHAGLADLLLPEDARAAVIERLQQARWPDDVQAAHRQLDGILAGFALPAAPGPLQQHAALIETLCGGDQLDQIVAAILADATDDPWLAAARATLQAGAPGSVRLGFELQRRCRGGSLADAFRQEFITALHCAAHGDFAEGIRALLIDKDRSPRWQPATLTEADAAWADTFFHSPWPPGQHPLADLGRDDPTRH